MIERFFGGLRIYNLAAESIGREEMPHNIIPSLQAIDSSKRLGIAGTSC